MSNDKDKWYNRLYMPGDYLPSMNNPEIAIMETWGKRCENVVMFSLKSSDSAEVRINQLETDNLDSWAATYEAVKFISKDMIDDYDWFVKVEDDTFVIMENLAYYLSIYNASTPLYFGHPYEFWGQTFQSSGAGIVLSQSALRKLNNKLIKGDCTPNTMSGDAMLGRCLSELGIEAIDTRDSRGRARFLVYQPEFHLIPGNLPWTNSFWSESKYVSPEVSVRWHYLPIILSLEILTFVSHMLGITILLIFYFYITSDLVLCVDSTITMWLHPVLIFDFVVN